MPLGFCFSFPFLALFLTRQTLANASKVTRPIPTTAKQCGDVYNSFYAGPNKKIESILQDVKKQLTQIQDDINVLKGNKTSVKGILRSILWLLHELNCQTFSFRNPKNFAKRIRRKGRLLRNTDKLLKATANELNLKRPCFYM